MDVLDGMFVATSVATDVFAWPTGGSRPSLATAGETLKEIDPLR
jgi:hypothetical protein